MPTPGKKNGVRPMRTVVRVHTIASTRLALAFATLGGSFLAAAAAVSGVPTTRPTTLAVVTPTATLSSQALPDQNLVVPTSDAVIGAAPLMNATITVPTKTRAQLRSLTFNVLRATESGWEGDPTGCGLAKYSLTTATGQPLALSSKQIGDGSAVQFVLGSPLVVTGSVTVQLRANAFWPEAINPANVQNLQGCRFLPILADNNLDLVDEKQQSIVVSGGPVYGALTEIAVALPQVSWVGGASTTVLSTDGDQITLARLAITNRSEQNQTVNVDSIPFLVRSNAVASGTLEFRVAPRNGEAYTETLLPEEWQTQNTVLAQAAGAGDWVVAPNQTLELQISVRGQLTGQPGWFACTSIPADSELGWNLGETTQTTPVRLPEVCVVKP